MALFKEPQFLLRFNGRFPGEPGLAGYPSFVPDPKITFGGGKWHRFLRAVRPS